MKERERERVDFEACDPHDSLWHRCPCLPLFGAHTRFYDATRFSWHVSQNHTTQREGFVLGVRKNAVNVLVPHYGLEGPLYFDAPDADQQPVLSYDPDKMTLQVRHAGASHTFAIFEKVTVEISVDNSDMQRRRSVNCRTPLGHHLTYIFSWELNLTHVGLLSLSYSTRQNCSSPCRAHPPGAQRSCQ